MRYLRTHINFALMGRSLLVLQARMCPSVGARLRLMLVYAGLVANALLPWTGRSRTRRLRIRVGGRERDWWVADPMEVAALSEVFVAGEYSDWLPDEAPSLIVDAGANIGSATLWFRERFPNARIIAIEPNPHAFSRLERNVGGDSNVQLVNAALAATDGTGFFACEPMTPVGRLQAHDGPDVVSVEALTLATIRERYADGARIDMLKLDVEGTEWPVLEGPLTNIGTIAMEIHDPVPGNRDPDAVLSEVAAREGFELRQGISETAAPEKLRWLVPLGVPARHPEPQPTS
jgi:FkbM family methyltransferase